MQSKKDGCFDQFSDIYALQEKGNALRFTQRFILLTTGKEALQTQSNVIRNDSLSINLIKQIL